jgi:hypothetical protein
MDITHLIISSSYRVKMREGRGVREGIESPKI